MPTWFLVHSWGSSISLLSLYSALMVLNAKSVIFLHSSNWSQSEMTHSVQKIIVSILSILKGVKNMNSNNEKNNANFIVKEKFYLWNMINTLVLWHLWHFIVRHSRAKKCMTFYFSEKRTLKRSITIWVRHLTHPFSDPNVVMIIFVWQGKSG